jgi:hypothetical protein
MAPEQENREQTAQRKRALAAGERARAISATKTDQRIASGLEVDVGTPQGVEL